MKNILFTFQNENDTVFIGSGEETKKAVTTYLSTLWEEQQNISTSYCKIIREYQNQVENTKCKFFKFRIDNAGMMWFEPYLTISPVLGYIQSKVNF